MEKESRSVEELETELVHIKREQKAAMLTITKLLKDLSKKTEEIEHLKTLVNQTVQVVTPKTTKLIQEFVPAEEEIALLQLDRLRLAAKSRSLTLEETRMFDLLVKNKRLSQDASTINVSKANYRDVKEEDLLQIASKSDDKESSDTDKS